MGLSFPAPVKAPMGASGGPAPITLMELVTVAGLAYFWSDATFSAPSVLLEVFSGSGIYGFGPVPQIAGADVNAPIPERPPTGTMPTVNFLPGILTPPVITRYKTVKASTATVSIENISGDTIRRTTGQIFAAEELVTALVFLRCFRIDSGFAIDSFMGNVADASIAADGDSLDLSIVGVDNWAQTPAPREQISSTCSSIFNSGGAFYACGSTSDTPCNNDYGTCSSLNRFKGVITEWIGSELPQTQVAQSPPLRLYNPRSAG
jgi:hypothetical protein